LLSQETCAGTIGDDGKSQAGLVAVAVARPPENDRPTRVPIVSLRPADSPRVDGESMAHVRALAEMDGEVPPIVVHRRTMRVIDGMHRLRAAILRGQDAIAARFVDGEERELFVLAVELNSGHGLPLSQKDRIAAATRVIGSHPQWSDRMIANLTGLSGKTVAAIRGRSTEETPQLNGRIGRDGKVRPLNVVRGRRMAGELMMQRPDASLREIARETGISVGTAQDVRKRLLQGADLAPRKQRPGQRLGGDADSGPDTRPPADRQRSDQAAETVATLLRQLKQDPSLRFSEIGRKVLRLLDAHSIPAATWEEFRDSIPTHCANAVADVARDCASTWLRFAEQLDRELK
jgi:hypothetical protein